MIIVMAMDGLMVMVKVGGVRSSGSSVNSSDGGEGRLVVRQNSDINLQSRSRILSLEMSQ